MKKIQSLIIIFSLLFNSGCITSEMWNEKEYYDDTIKQYLISEDGNKVIFLGKKYHYIFDDNSGIIRQLLNWKGRQKLVMNIYDFKAISESDIKLSVWISSSFKKESSSKNLENLSKDEIAFLTKLVFSDQKWGNNQVLAKKLNLSGTRYLPKPAVDYKVGNSSLNKEYKVRVELEHESALNKSKKIALTPVTVVGDTITIVGGAGVLVVVLAIALPIYMVGSVVADVKKHSH
jgi:hypothetical protein